MVDWNGAAPKREQYVDDIVGGCRALGLVVFLPVHHGD
jgi:hypothetical protein